MSILAGKRILVTRALNQNAKLIAKLESRGAIALVYPCIEIAFLPFEIPHAHYDWVIFTSQNAVKALGNLTLSQDIQIATVGPKTSPLTPLHPVERGIKHPVHTFNSKSLAQLFENQPPQKILLPQGDLADHSLADTLTQQGHDVTRLTVYSTRKPTNPVAFDFGPLDAVTFTSPSTIKNFCDLRGLPAEALAQAGEVIACIGTTTYQAARDLGFTNLIHAKEHSLDGLVQILEEYFT